MKTFSLVISSMVIIEFIKLFDVETLSLATLQVMYPMDILKSPEKPHVPNSSTMFINSAFQHLSLQVFDNQ